MRGRPGHPRGTIAAVTRRGTTVALLVVLFALSVAIRAPFLGRPLGRDTEAQTATVARTQTIWYERGALATRFLPIMTYGSPGDRFICDQARLVDDDGDWYYTSYGSLSYVVPYLLVRAVGLAPSVLALQLFNVATHALICLLLFLTVRLLRHGDGRRFSDAAAATAVIVYLLAPGPLWLHGNGYMADMFVQVPFALGVYLAVRLAAGSRSPWIYVLLAVTTYLMTLTEWLGACFGITLVVWSVVGWRRRYPRPLLAVGPVAVALAIGTIAWHYAQIDGLRTWWDSATATLRYRAGSAGATDLTLTSLEAWRLLAKSYVFVWAPQLLLVTVLLCWALATRERRRAGWSLVRRPTVAAPLLVTALPVALHHVLLWEWTAKHHMAALKLGFLLAVVAALAVDLLLSPSPESATGARVTRRRIVIVLVAVAVCLSTAQFVVLTVHWGTDDFRLSGRTIAARTPSDAMAFVRTSEGSGGVPWPQLVYYAHRNIASYYTPESAVKQMELAGVRRGVVFTTDPSGERILAAQDITLDRPQVSPPP